MHKDFQLNNRSFTSSEELLDFSKTISISLYNFLKDWFHDGEYLIVKTSGSTGKPKDIQLKKEYMKNSALATGAFFDIQNKTTALCCLPIDFIAGKMMVVRALILGWHIDIVEPSSNPLKGIDQEYDFSAMVPLQLSNSLDKIHQIDTLIVGGGAVSSSLLKELQKVSTHIYATYGMTETITHIAIKQLNLFPHTPIFSPDDIEKYQLTYQALQNVSLSKDERGCLMINAPKVSDEAIITNDMVELISETEFIWKGRYDNVINSGGIKLHPEEIEGKLSSLIQSRFFVTGISDDKLGEKLVLIVEGEEQELPPEIFENLSKFEIPKKVLFVSEFIETKTGKIQRIETLGLLGI